VASNVTRIRKRTEAADDVAAEVMNHVAESKQIQQSSRWEWYDAVAFVRGDQWTYWDPGARRMRRRPALPWRVRLTDNQTLPQITMQRALLTERIPAFRAMARTEEEGDVLAALGFEALLIYHWDRLDLTDKLGDALDAALVTGNGFWRVSWDANAGVPVQVPLPVGSDVAGAKDAPKAEEPKGDEAQMDDFFMPLGAEPTEETVFTGDVSVQVVSPFSMHVDTVARSLSEARWVCQESFVHMDVLRDKFGAKVDKINPDVGPQEYYNYEQHLRFDSGSANSISDDFKSRVRVLEFWEAPSKKHPSGRVITVAGGMTLDARDNPYGGRFPYVHFPAIKVHGRFWADGYVKHLRPLQAMHNRAISRFHEIMNLMGNPKWIVDKGSGIKETAINDRPGEVLFKAPGSVVQAVPPPPPPTIHPQIMSLAMNHMQNISGVNDPLVGQNPPNVRSGRSIAFLQEAGMRRFVPLALQTESALKSAGRLVLHLVQRFYGEDRTIRILGRDSKPEVHHISKADVDRVMDVTIEHGAMIPRSKAAQQDTVLELLQRAPMLFTGEDGKLMRNRLFRMLDIPVATDRLTPDIADRNQAYQEHIEAKRGEPVQAMPWEDHVLHMQIHRAWLQSEDAKRNPEAMQAIASNYAEHEMALQQGLGPVQPTPESPLGGVGGGPAPPGAGGGPGEPGLPPEPQGGLQGGPK
jgi:hypothetical protein